ncbi:MAG: arsenic efflux protein [Lachnospiraceae bacterium]|nr:arsenic efflux protein [Lachnospiraceae bacterium]
MSHEIIHIIVHTLEDSLKLVPFLFLTYLVMEYLEHKTGEKAQDMVQRAGKWGPLIGGLAGAVPQCGFSAAASNLYAGRVITLGTLLAIYLSTSDEMLPILISGANAQTAPPEFILKVLAIKAGIGILAGFVIDLCFRGKGEEHAHIHELCEQEHCHCEKGIFRSAFAHTLQITFFILVITLGLNVVLNLGGEKVLSDFLLNRPILGPVLAGIVGLIPNCAASVVITQLYLEGALGVGAMMSGLLVGAGVGVLVLFRVNHNRRENLKVVGLLYLIGVVSGIVLEFVM